MYKQKEWIPGRGRERENEETIIIILTRKTRREGLEHAHVTQIAWLKYVTRVDKGNQDNIFLFFCFAQNVYFGRAVAVIA